MDLQLPTQLSPTSCCSGRTFISHCCYFECTTRFCFGPTAVSYLHWWFVKDPVIWWQYCPLCWWPFTLSPNHLLTRKILNTFKMMLINFVTSYLSTSWHWIQTSNCLPSVYVNRSVHESVLFLQVFWGLISCDLSWSNHVKDISLKARRQVGLLYRHFYKHALPIILWTLYTALIRPY